MIDWLAPRTENGLPILEMDLAELRGSIEDYSQRRMGQENEEEGNV